MITLNIYGLDSSTTEIAVIPSLQKSASRYEHTFPFEVAKSEKMEDAIINTFYRLLANTIEEKKKFKVMDVKDPDAFPYYKKAEYKDVFKDEEGIADVPGSEFEFTFNGKSPDYILQIDSLEIYSNSAINDHNTGTIGGTGIVSTLVAGGIALAKNAEAKRTTGGIAVEFKYFIWNNNKKKLVKLDCCRIIQKSSNTTKEDWQNMMHTVIKDVFYVY